MRKNVAGQKVYFSLFKSGTRINSPTLATGDVKVALDTGAQANVNTLPTSDAAGLLTWSPTQAETNADTVILLLNDQVGAEWEPLTIVFDTTVSDASVADAVWDEVLTGATHNVTNSAGKRVRQLADVIIYGGTAVTGTANTITLDAGASSIDGAYDPAIIYIAEGTGSGQSRGILEYFGSARLAVVDRSWKVIPDNTSVFEILADAGREHVNEGLARGGATTSITLNTNASSANDAYIGQRVFIRSGTGEDQARRISAYNGTTKVATVTRAWDIVPDTTSAYVILPTGAITDVDIANAVWEALRVDYSGAGSFGAVNEWASVGAAGSGAITYDYNVSDPDGTPVDGVYVWVTLDAAGNNIVASAYTDVLGNARFYLDAGTYYFWANKSGYNFTLPDTEVVA